MFRMALRRYCFGFLEYSEAGVSWSQTRQSSCDLGSLGEETADILCRVSWETDQYPPHRSHRLQLGWTKQRQQPLLTTMLRAPRVTGGVTVRFGGLAMPQGMPSIKTQVKCFCKNHRAQKIFSYFLRALMRLCRHEIKGNRFCGPHVISDMHRHVPCTKPALLLFVNPLCRQQMGGRASFSIFPWLAHSTGLKASVCFQMHLACHTVGLFALTRFAWRPIAMSDGFPSKRSTSYVS